jgi:hypothetical protein
VARGDGVDPVHQPQHLGGAADHRLVGLVLGQLRARIVQLAQQRAVLGDAPDPQGDLVDVERLGQVVVRPLLDGRDGVLNGGERGHQDHGGLGRLLTRPPEERQTVDSGQSTS